jgi:hypothetical protein
MGETMGERLNKRSPLEALVAPLIPKACREEVLGDLHERNSTSVRYVLDALRTMPLVIASRIRRTSDRCQLSLCTIVLYFSFFTAAWFEARQLIYEPGGPWRLAIPCAAALLGMVLDDAYSDPSRTPFSRRLRGPMVAIGAALVSQGALWAAGSSLFLPLAIVLRGAASALAWTLIIRFSFQPPSQSRQGRA